jgi:hypothetical protein
LSFYDPLAQELVAIKQVEWRYVLAYPSSTFTLEIHHNSREGGVLGLLDILLTMTPRKGFTITEQMLENRLASDKAVFKRDLERFLDYSEKWLEGVKQARTGLDRVSIYA